MLGIVVLRYKAELLLDVLYRGELSASGERMAALVEELLCVVGDHASRDFHLLDGVREVESFVDWYDMGNASAGFDSKTCHPTIMEEGRNRRLNDVHVFNVESIEHNGDHSLSARLGGFGFLSEDHALYLLRVDFKLVVEHVMPQLLHILPIFDHTVDDGVLKVKAITPLLGLNANVP